MATGKRYYWIKLKESFMTSDTIDYFMEQPDGANYVVLYQMLCLKTINTGGRLSRQIGQIIIPYDVEKIQRDCKWFSADTVRVALNLYQAVGLIYEDTDGTLVLTDHKDLVGSETDYAVQKKNQRKSPPQLPTSAVDNVHSNVHKNVHTDIEIDIRDKRLEKRDKSLETRERDRRGGVGEIEPSTSAAAPPEQSGAAAPTSSGSGTKKKFGAYGWVRLTDDEYTRLLDELGEAEFQRCIAYIDESAQSSGNKNKWKDWNLVIRRCSRDRWGIRSGSVNGNADRRSSAGDAMDNLQQLHQMYESWEGEQDD